MTDTAAAAINDKAVELAAKACHDSDFALLSPGIHDEYWRKMARAALTAALPALLPSREAVAEVLLAHRIDCGPDFACICGWNPDSDGYVAHLREHNAHHADAILALLNPAQG